MTPKTETPVLSLLLPALLTLILWHISAKTTHGQIMDDFSDGDFIAGPAWISSNESGNGSDFQIINEELNSNGPSSSTTLWISTPGMTNYQTGQTIWQFSCRYLSAPSGSNNIRVYLLSNAADLTNATEGYYIRLGESGSADGIDLYRVGSSTPVVEDANPTVSSEIDVTIRVIRDGDGTWTLEADPGSQGSFLLIGTGTDTTPVSGDYFGFLVNHTTTRRQGFFFDDVSVTFVDNQPPKLLQAEVIDDITLDLVFSEPPERSVASDVTNYNVNNGVGHPVTAIRDTTDPARVRLIFETPFASGIIHELTVVNMKDDAGNIAGEEKAEFLYYKEVIAGWRDVIFTELMVDPTPPNDLPESEFIELYNNSTKVFRLTDWTIEDRVRTGGLEEWFFFPGEYLILCPLAFVSQFSDFGQTIGVASFPTLNDSGDVLVLRDNHGMLLDSISYDNFWYRGSSRTEGWTLELIDPANPCSDSNNWAVSEDERGGTPGSQNSIFAEKPDLSGPEVVEVLAAHPDTITVRLNEKVEPESVPAASFLFKPEVGINEILLSENRTELTLTMSEGLLSGVLYELTITGLLDCSGNQNLAEPQVFALLEEPDKNDILINEILFNPVAGGHDFVELYNNSDKYINLGNISVGNFEIDSAGNPKIINSRSVTAENRAFPPHSYLAITTDIENIANHYPLSRVDDLLEVSRLPSFPDKDGSVALSDTQHILIDYFEYSEDFHFELLADKEGISLERVSFDVETNEQHNWKSAASTVGFATPGYRNSQLVSRYAVPSGGITVDPKVIIPDGSGLNDFTTIAYQFETPGNVANVRIFDPQGREIAVLANNDILAAAGFYTWTGTNAEGRKVRTGYYLVYFEVFDARGNVSKHTEKVVVGNRF